jgi:hypothetical protein
LPSTAAIGASQADRIRLLTFTTLFAIGGTERHLVNLTDGLDHGRFDLEFACLKRHGEFLPHIEARGLPINEYPVRNLYGPNAFAQELRFARSLRRRRVSPARRSSSRRSGIRDRT